MYTNIHAVSATTGPGDEKAGTLAKNEIMRYVLDGVGGEGVTVRLCVRQGMITFYVSQVTTPSEEMYDKKSIIAPTDKLAIDCSTIFTGTFSEPGTAEQTRERRQKPSQTTTLYLSIEGQGIINTFLLQSGNGNITFGEHVKILWVEELTNKFFKLQMSMSVNGAPFLAINQQHATTLMAASIVNAKKDSMVMGLSAPVSVQLHT